MNPKAAAVLESKYVKDLYKLPDWLPMHHCYHAVQMLKDIEEPQKSLYQIMAIKAIQECGDPNAIKLINIMIQKENLTEQNILSPAAAIYASNVVSSSFRSTGFLGLSPSVRKKYQEMSISVNNS